MELESLSQGAPALSQTQTQPSPQLILKASGSELGALTQVWITGSSGTLGAALISQRQRGAVMDVYDAGGHGED